MFSRQNGAVIPDTVGVIQGTFILSGQVYRWTELKICVCKTMKIHCIVPSKKYISMETILSKRREMISHQGYLQSYAPLPVSERFFVLSAALLQAKIFDKKLVCLLSGNDLKTKGEGAYDFEYLWYSFHPCNCSYEAQACRSSVWELFSGQKRFSNFWFLNPR